MTTITIATTQTTHPLLSDAYIGDLMNQFDNALSQSNSINSIKEPVMSELAEAIIGGEYEIEVTEVEGVIVEFTLQTFDTIGTYTRVNPEFQTIRNAIVDCTGVLRDDLDISFYRYEVNRGNLEAYCRAVLLNQFIDNRMELVERAVRTVQNIEARPAGWEDTRA